MIENVPKKIETHQQIHFDLVKMNLLMGFKMQ